MHGYPMPMPGVAIGTGGATPFKSLVESAQAKSAEERKTIARALDALQVEIGQLSTLREYAIDRLSPVLVSVPSNPVLNDNSKAPQFPGSPVCCQLQQMTEQLREQINEITEIIERADVN